MSENIPYKTLATNYLLKTPWRNFRVDQVEFNNKTSSFSYVEAPDAVFIVPLTTDGCIVLIRHYRYIIGQWTMEVPAGALDDPKEAPDDTVRRELIEEIGGRCNEVVLLSNAYSSSGHLTTKGYYYLATGVEVNEAERTEEDKLLIRWEKVPAREALAMARRGEVNETQSAMALLLAEPYVLQWLEANLPGS